MTMGCYNFFQFKVKYNTNISLSAKKKAKHNNLLTLCNIPFENTGRLEFFK